MLSKYGNCMHLLKIKNKLKIFFFFTNQVGKNSQYFVSILNKMIIPLAFVGYEMIIANSYNPTCSCGIIVNNKLIPVAQSLKYNTSALKVKFFFLYSFLLRLCLEWLNTSSYCWLTVLFMLRRWNLQVLFQWKCHWRGNYSQVVIASLLFYPSWAEHRPT